MPGAGSGPSSRCWRCYWQAGARAGWYYRLGPGARQARLAAPQDGQTYTTAVKRGSLSISAAGSGKLVASRSVNLRFSTSGTVAVLNVKLGDLVKAGDVLASLGSSETLEANLAAAQLQALQASKALDDLQQGASLSLAQAYSDLLAAQDKYDAALTASQKVNAARCSKSVTTRYKAALDSATEKLKNIHAETAKSDVTIAAKKVYDTALANYTFCAGYTSDEKAAAQSAVEVAQTALQTAQDHYDTLKAAAGIDPGELALDEAKVKEAQTQLANAKEALAGITLAAPMDGRITYLAAPAGTQVDTAKYITISDVSTPTLEISVDESDMSKLIVGSSVTVTFDALEGQSFSGKVVQVDPQVTQSGQYRVAKGVVALDASEAKTVSNLPLGLSASVTVVNQEVKDALIVPVVALKSQDNGTYAVMVQSSDGQLKLQPVTVGIQGGDYAQVTSGLSEEILTLLHDLHDRGRTIVMVTHEPDVAHHTERIITMRDGELYTDHKSCIRRSRRP